jgi:threonine/homoserine/homoserine lactone efflux protein
VVDLLPPWPQFGVLLGAVIVLGVTPGPGVFYILATSIAQGARSGLASVLGIAAGTFVHVLLAVFGLKLLLASSAVFFSIRQVCWRGLFCYSGSLSCDSAGRPTGNSPGAVVARDVAGFHAGGDGERPEP